MRASRVSWSSRVPLQHRLASHYRNRRLLLVGDAAHVHSPAGGQGMNTGIQDAANLGWKLGFATDPTSRSVADRLLDSYAAERRPVARQIMAITHAMFWAESSTDPIARLARGTLAPLGAPIVPVLLQRRQLVAASVRILGQLRVHYRRSVLSVEGDRRRSPGVRPGDRLPDSTVNCDGRAVRLHDLLACPGVHLLLGRDAHGPRRSRTRLVHIHRISDRPGPGVIAVRPDGYVGFRGSTDDPDHLHQWLSMIGAAGSGPPPIPASPRFSASR